MPTQALPERLTPLASKAGVRAFYGDIHNHCGLSYGFGSLSGALRNARQQLDFVSVTGHAYWPDMPIDDPSVAHIVDFHVKGFARLKERWPTHFQSLAEFHDPGRFTVFPGYEMHSSANGDYTIVLRDLDQREMPRGDTPDLLQKALRHTYGDRAFAFPHHIGYRTGARGINWDSFREDLSPVLEMISMHGCAETSLTDRPFLHSMGPSDGHNTVHYGLNRGHVFGVLGNTDHHSGYPGSYGHGRSAVYAPENTSAAIWDAIHQRHTNALTGDNCHLFARLGDAIPGDKVAPARVADLAVEAVAGSFIDYVDVIKNGVVSQRITPVVAPAPIALDGDSVETVLVLELGWGSRGRYQDWTADLAIEGGEILAVEPRFRGPEIVSPEEGREEEAPASTFDHDRTSLSFSLRTHANPNNFTAATQAIAMRVRLAPGAVIKAELCGVPVEVSAERLFSGALSGNLGAIDTPAFRFHPLPRPKDWQWHGTLAAGPFRKGDWLALRMRQANGQWAWTSPFFCR